MTETSDLRSVLSAVAAGSLSPEEATVRLSQATTASGTDAPPADAPPADAPPADAPQGSDTSAEPRTTSGPIERIVVRANAAKLVLVADPTVVGADVEGPHVARRDGGALVIDTDATPGPDTFSYESGGKRYFGGLPWKGPHKVIVRVRPDLPVEARVAAGSIVATGLRGGLRFTVEAGSLKASDCSGALDGRVEAGSAKLDWRLVGASSALRCELGSIQLRLAPDSDVTVKAKAELGSVDLGRTAKGSGAQQQLVVGQGLGELDVRVSLGSVKVQVA